MTPIIHYVWDKNNVEHIKKHGITPEETEEALNNQTYSVPTYAGRVLTIGQSKNKKIITIILDGPVDSGYYVVTARSASRKERRLYMMYQEKLKEVIYDKV